MHTIRDMKPTTPISSALMVDPHAIRNERIGTLLMVFGGGLASLAWYIPLLYQGAWTLLVCILPFMRKY